MNALIITSCADNVTLHDCLILTERTPEQEAEALHIPVIAEIDPQPDPVLGHTFKWPEEVAQFLAEQAQP